MIPNLNQYNEAQQKRLDNVKSNIVVQFATVIQLSIDGSPIIQFDGDKLPSGKLYPFFKSYIPVVGDRVQIINNIIQGGWITNDSVRV